MILQEFHNSPANHFNPRPFLQILTSGACALHPDDPALLSFPQWGEGLTMSDKDLVFKSVHIQDYKAKFKEFEVTSTVVSGTWGGELCTSPAELAENISYNEKLTSEIFF